MTGADLLIAAIVVLVAGAVITALVARNRLATGYVAFFSALIASAFVTQLAFAVLTTGPVHSASPVLYIPCVNTALIFEIDQLSAVFLLITALSAVCSTLYSIRYMLIYDEYSLARYYPMLLLFFASIFALLSVHNLFFFVVFWEIMTLTSYALIVFEKRDAEVRQSAVIYFIVSQTAVVLMAIAVIILYLHTPTRSFAIEDFRQAIAALMIARPWLAHLCIGLFMVAAATKAGILPFGFWVPHAQPAAPSPFSAVMPGCMEKMGVYRCLLVLAVIMPLSAATVVWGVLVALFGTASMVIGTLTALQQSDTKRLLAFHAIGQMGYIWLAIGIGVAFLPTRPELAALALVAALFHAINHSAFKALLFLNAGAALYRTGTRDMDKAGGLMRIMPATAAMAIIASLAISGIPGFNGFASKWLIFESSLLAGFHMPLMVFLGIIAIFISAITLASFLKFLGLVFLGSLHVEQSVERREVPASMVAAQAILAVFCVLFGVVPLLPIKYLYRTVSTTLSAGHGLDFNAIFGDSILNISLRVPGSGAVGAWGPLMILAALAGCLLLAYLISRIGHSKIREVPVWLCGEDHPAEEVRYPVHSFLLPFRRYFKWLYPSVGIPKLPRFW